MPKHSATQFSLIFLIEGTPPPSGQLFVRLFNEIERDMNEAAMAHEKEVTRRCSDMPRAARSRHGCE
jgi:hypothetical protein